MIGKRSFTKSRNEIQHDTNNLAQKLLAQEVSLEYCEMEARILITKAMAQRKDKELYKKLLNEACMFLIFAKIKNDAI